MSIGVVFKGEFIDVYPYMNWIFLVNQEGDLLQCRTELLVEGDTDLHDALFRQKKAEIAGIGNIPKGIIELSTEKFKKLGKIADKSKFCDLRFFYSNIFCGSEDGLDFIYFDTHSEEACNYRKVTDVPIASIAAKFMTVFAASVEANVTTLFDVSAGVFSKPALTGSVATRVSISDSSVNYYFGRTDLKLAGYEKSRLENGSHRKTEQDREKIDSIEDAHDFSGDLSGVDYVFNSNKGIYFVRGNALEYRMNNGRVHEFPFGFDGKLVRAHLIPGGKCFEFMEGIYCVTSDGNEELLRGECISSRGYANSINFNNSVSAVNESGAYIFKL